MSTEPERLAEVITDLGRRLSQALGDVISPEAQRHLRNAQREVLTALFLVYEDQVGRRGVQPREADADDLDGGWPPDMEGVIGAAARDFEEDEPLPRPVPGRPARRRPAPARGRSRVTKIDLD